METEKAHLELDMQSVRTVGPEWDMRPGKGDFVNYASTHT